MSNFNVAIPSHRRADLLPLLMKQFSERMREATTIFVSDRQDEIDYAHLGAKVVTTETASLRDKLNYIHTYYPIGTKVFQVEDDVTFVEAAPDNKSKARQLENLEAKIETAFSNQPKGLWGFGSTANPFYMIENDRRGLYFVPGFAFGFTSTHDKSLELTQHFKTDYERTIKYFLKYGPILRVGNTGIATKSYETAGGLQQGSSTEARRQKEEECVQYLLDRYGYVLRRNPRRKSPMPEIAFRSPKIHVDEARLMERRRNATRQ